MEREATRASSQARAGAPVEPISRGPSFVARASTAWLVDDEVDGIEPNQLRRSEFLRRLRAEVCSAADAALRPIGRSADGCPQVDLWFGIYATRDAGQVERTIRRYAPETASATSAAELIPPIVARVRQAIERWVATGDVTGMPDEIEPDDAARLVASAALQMTASSATAAAGALAAAAPSFASGLRAAASQVTGPFLASRTDEVDRPGEDPIAVRGAMGSSEPLDGRTRVRMEFAFGTSLAGVRVHRDAQAAATAERLAAHALTVGSDIAFASGAYRPGTLVGDALIAHELAHTVQQSGAVRAEGVDNGGMERNANRSTIGALANLWAPVGRTAAARMSTGLIGGAGLSVTRCGGPAQSTAARTTTPAHTAAKPATEAASQRVIEKPPAPEQSYWFEDPKKQVKEGDQDLDFTKKDRAGSGGGITTTAQQRQQVIVDKRDDFSRVGSVVVRFGYSATAFGGGEESVRTKQAKAAVLAALRDVLRDVDGMQPTKTEWNSKEEEKQVRAEAKSIAEQRARLLEVFKGYSQDRPLNIYLAPETEEEVISGQFMPTTAQVWISEADVGDPAKLRTALRVPLQHVLGGPNAAKGGGADAPADMRRTMIHEGLHAMLIARGADSSRLWKELESRIKVTAPESLRQKVLNLARATLLAQEELFVYGQEETLYAPVTSGPQASGKGMYEVFQNQVERLFKAKGVTIERKAFALTVAESVDKKAVGWSIAYRLPTEITISDSDAAAIDMTLSVWPLR